MRISEDRRWKVEERESDEGDRFGRMVRKKKGGRWKGRWEGGQGGKKKLVQDLSRRSRVLYWVYWVVWVYLGCIVIN